MLNQEHYFVFDVESIGLHGQAFAVAGGVYHRTGKVFNEFSYHCDPKFASGAPDDRAWVAKHVTVNKESKTKASPLEIRLSFWSEWTIAMANYPGIMMAAECLWPVEANFLSDCVKDNHDRRWNAPYPLLDISSMIFSAGMNPNENYERISGERPAHEPLADSRQSARLMFWALRLIHNEIKY